MKGRKKLHILLILQRLNTGGAERQASYLADYLQNVLNKHITVYYFGNKNDNAYKWFQTKKINCYSFGFTEKLVFRRNASLADRLRSCYYRLRMVIMLRRVKPDVLMPFTTFEPNIIIGSLWKWTGAKACIWNQRDAGGYFQLSPSEIRVLNQCSSWIANSTSAENYLKGFRLKDVHKIYNGVVLPDVKAVHAEKDVVRVVMVANIHSNKDHLTLLKAWHLLINQKGDYKPHLFLAGYKGDRFDEVTEFISSNHLEKSVTLLGMVNDVASFISQCDIGAFSSKLEGLPNGILECMSVGLPVVATDIDGSRDALGIDYPFLAPVGEAGVMATQLLTLIQNSTLRAEIGKRNRDRIGSYFSIMSMAEAFNQEIERLYYS